MTGFIGRRIDCNSCKWWKFNSSGKVIHRLVPHWTSHSHTDPRQNPSAQNSLCGLDEQIFTERRNYPQSLVAVWATGVPEGVLVAPVNSRLLLRSANVKLWDYSWLQRCCIWTGHFAFLALIISISNWNSFIVSLHAKHLFCNTQLQDDGVGHLLIKGW